MTSNTPMNGLNSNRSQIIAAMKLYGLDILFLGISTAIGFLLGVTTSVTVFESTTTGILIAILAFTIFNPAKMRELKSIGSNLETIYPFLSVQDEIKALRDPCLRYIAERCMRSSATPTCAPSPDTVTFIPSGVVFDAYKFFWEYFRNLKEQPTEIQCVHSTLINVWHARPDFLDVQRRFTKGTITRIIVGKGRCYDKNHDCINAIKSMLGAGITVYYVDLHQVHTIFSAEYIHDYVWVRDTRYMFTWTKNTDGVTIDGAEIKREQTSPITWDRLLKVIGEFQIRPMTELADCEYLIKP